MSNHELRYEMTRIRAFSTAPFLTAVPLAFLPVAHISFKFNIMKLPPKYGIKTIYMVYNYSCRINGSTGNEKASKNDGIYRLNYSYFSKWVDLVYNDSS